jgi:acyl-CoA thioesterase FadM
LTNRITYDHIDLHNHVNNTKYFGFFLKLLPRTFHEKHQVREFHINFNAELQWGDEAKIEMEPTITRGTEDKVFQHRIVNQDDKVSALGLSMWSRA